MHCKFIELEELYVLGVQMEMIEIEANESITWRKCKQVLGSSKNLMYCLENMTKLLVVG